MVFGVLFLRGFITILSNNKRMSSACFVSLCVFFVVFMTQGKDIFLQELRYIRFQM